MHDGRVWSEQEDIKAFGLKEFQKDQRTIRMAAFSAVEENGIIRGKVQGWDVP